MANFLAPPQVAKALVGAGEKKAALPFGNMTWLGVLAGVYIAFGAHLASTVATGSFEYFGLKKLLIGGVFSVGLMLVVIAGAELFTGNNLLSIAAAHKKITIGGLMRNWSVVYIANFVGSILMALIIAKWSGLLDGPVGTTAIKIAYGKVSSVQEGLNHNWAYFFRAICCNWLVCLAVYLAIAAQLLAGIDGILNRMDPTELGYGPVDEDIFTWPAEKRAQIKALPTSLPMALEALATDHDFLLAGDVFSEDLIERWIASKREEDRQVRNRPHPYEIELYYDL